MHIIMLGVDHTTAPIAFRERLAFTQRQVPQFINSVSQLADECVLLSTCNRVELYAVVSEPHGIAEQLLSALAEARAIPLDELQRHSYICEDEQAVSHLLGVAAGLFSQVPGEPQIQGQVAGALEIAQGAGYAGPITSALFRAALVTGKRARSETAISRNAASVSHVAVQLARQLFPNLNEACVLLVGSGKMSELAAQNVCAHGAQRLIIINRTQTHAIDLAQRFGAQHRTFSELAQSLLEADVVISSTTAPRAIITVDMIEAVMQQRAGRSLLLIDIALPRDVEAQVAHIPGVHLYNLDDLQASVDEGIRLRMQEVEQVRSIITAESASFQRWLRSLSVTGTISDLRQRVDLLREQELARAMQRLPDTLTERETAAVRELTTRLVNKLLHTPTLRLKHAAAEGQGHIYAEAIRYLFDLEVQLDEKTSDEYNNRNTGQQTGSYTDTVNSRTAASTVACAGHQNRADTHEG
ncbi:MAG TPA: glutamyl-tRNA reductase [Ktedonobacteraceae bacterium]|nr:glutamyl-tRNA reductase [Ktedonobacteraceae bacterium]